MLLFLRFFKCWFYLVGVPKVERGIYRMNPFIYVPYQADAQILQDEWKELFSLSLEKESNPK